MNAGNSEKQNDSGWESEVKGDESDMGLGSGRLPKIVAFRELCRCGDEVWIEHGGQLYRLRRTRQDKLILTK